MPQFPTGVMRGRFHPQNGQLYCCGMFAWAGNQTQPGGFYRVRYTGKPVYLPIGSERQEERHDDQFSGALDPKIAERSTKLRREDLVAEAERSSTVPSTTTRSRPR